MHKKQWRFLDTGAGSAVFNMALDEALLQLADRPDSSPVFRVYRWNPPAVSLGYSQDAGEIIDMERCRADGIDVVTRPTGGRAVYHENEITYSIIAPVDDHHFGGSLMETYSRISTFLCDVLRRLGVRAVFTRGAAGHENRHFADNAPCFISVSRYEITCNGKKIIGSAQRRFGKVFLQHGSILTGPGQGKIAHYYRNPPEPERLAEKIEERSANLRTIMGKSFSDDAVVEALFDGITMVVEADVIRSEPTDEEISLATKARRHKGIKRVKQTSEVASINR